MILHYLGLILAILVVAAVALRMRKWRIINRSTWQYDYDVQGRMWRKINGVTEYRPATYDEIKKLRLDTIMQQW
jgi:uncharacterized membrane protein